MRSLARAAERVARRPVSPSDESAACLRITTGLMLLLVLVLFVTSALPDLLPRLDQVVTAGL
jgi:membrane-associated protease RseP (regulator of RpoE activity)